MALCYTVNPPTVIGPDIRVALLCPCLTPVGIGGMAFWDRLFKSSSEVIRSFSFRLELVVSPLVFTLNGSLKRDRWVSKDFTMSSTVGTGAVGCWTGVNMSLGVDESRVCLGDCLKVGGRDRGRYCSLNLGEYKVCCVGGRGAATGSLRLRSDVLYSGMVNCIPRLLIVYSAEKEQIKEIN